MFKKGLIAAVVCMSSVSVCYAWPSLPSLPGVGSSSGSSSTSSFSASDVDSFIAQGKATSKLVSDSKMHIAMAIATKESKDKLTDSQNQIKAGLANNDKTTTDKEQKLAEAVDASLKESENDAAASDRLKGLSADQKQSVINAFYNLLLGIKQQSVQVVTGENILKGIKSNPTLLLRASDMKDALGDMGSNIKSEGEFMARIPALFKGAGIVPVLPTDASDKPKDVSSTF